MPPIPLPSQFNQLVDRAVDSYSASQNTPQLAAWVPGMWQNLTQGGNFRNVPSACGGDRKFQGFASLLEKKRLHLKKIFKFFLIQNSVGTVYFTVEIKANCALLIIRPPEGETSKINYFIRCDYFTLQ